MICVRANQTPADLSMQKGTGGGREEGRESRASHLIHGAFELILLLTLLAVFALLLFPFLFFDSGIYQTLLFGLDGLMNRLGRHLVLP